MSIELKIYNAVISECKAIDENNAHSFAIKLSRLVAIALLSEQQRLIFNELTITGRTTSEISVSLDLPSKNVSSVLIYLKSKLSFVYSKMDDKGNRVWITTLEVL